MMLPLFDDISLPPNTTLVDVNSLPNPEREQYQGLALQLWVDETGEEPPVREWDDNEGMFVVYESGTVIGVAIITDVEAL